MNKNMLNLIASFKKTGQSDEVIKQSLWQLGMIPEMIESHLDYFNKHTAQINKDINIVKENKDMKFPQINIHEVFAQNRELYKIMYNHIIPTLEKQLSSINSD